MIFFGVGRKAREGKRLLGAKCPNCQQDNLFAYREFLHFHIYWIPLVPLGSNLRTFCGNCKNVQTAVEMDANTKKLTARSAEHLRRPIYHFAAPVLLVAFIANVFWQNHQDDKRSAQILQALHKRDRVVINLMKFKGFTDAQSLPLEDEKYHYAAGEVFEVNEDTITIRLGDTGYKSVGTAERKMKLHFAGGRVVFTIQKSDLPRMVEKNILERAYRPKK